jgi:hypothetical protein
MHKRTILYIKNSLLNFKEKNGLEGLSKRQYKTDNGDIIYLTKQQYELYNNAGNYNLKPL